ncbi:MAG TPA: Rrf2 family transcriptional regulator [Anaerolineales bacterium]|nr:Rrf2 family transcriptional regulator [Anaerolineales bacterium]
MQITRQADYAVRAVMYLAQLGSNEKASTSQIAEEKDIPLSFLAKIIAQLSVAGLLQTMRGARGGVTLARQAEEISLLEVVEAIDGPILINECVNDSYDCSQHGCPMRSIWQEAQADLISRFKNTTFDQFVAENA